MSDLKPIVALFVRQEAPYDTILYRPDLYEVPSKGEDVIIDKKRFRVVSREWDYDRGESPRVLVKLTKVSG